MKRILTVALATFFLAIFISPTFAQEAKTYTPAEVMEHSSEDDCWVIFEDGVYDVTSFVENHDKFVDIRPWCGMDMTEDFKTKAGEGRDHKEGTYELLESMYLGELEIPQFSSEEVAMHDAEDDCWVIFEGGVYDVTSFVENHDKFVDIRPWCGIDMTEDFKTKAGEGRDHKEGTYELLETMYIGEFYEPELKTYTMEEVAMHDTEDDCWMVFEGSVYDITSRVESHDKFMDIRSWCGQDMTEDFKTKAGEGRDHKEGTYEMLASLKIGELLEDGSNDEPEFEFSNPYNFWVPVLGVIILYSLGWIIVRGDLDEKIPLVSKRNFNLFWNIILVISLVPSLVFGGIMTLQYQFDGLSDIAGDLYWMHVEGSLIFGTVAFMHFVSRFKQFVAPLKSMFRSRKRVEHKEEESKKIK